MILRQEDLRAEELYSRFKEGLSLNVPQREELICLLYRKAAASRHEVSPGKLRVGTDEAKDLWEACQGIIQRAKRFAFKGLPFDKQQVELHPISGEDAVLFMEFITQFRGHDYEFPEKLRKHISGKLNSEKRRIVAAKKEEQGFTDAVEYSSFDNDEPRLSLICSMVREKVSELEHEQREVIERRLNGDPVSRIANSIGVTPQSIYERTRRAYLKLKETLKETWEEYQELQSLRRMTNSRPRQNSADSYGHFKAYSPQTRESLALSRVDFKKRLKRFEKLHGETA